MIDVPVEVKDALREGTYKKNYRFVVLNEDGTPDETIGTIDNENLVSESVSIDERMCSGDTLKFGLCEGSSLEFQYFGKPNITGKRVQAFVDVDYELPPDTWGRVHLLVAPYYEPASYTITEAGTYRVNSGSWYMLSWTHDGETHTVEMHYQRYKTLGELVPGDVISAQGRGAQALVSIEKIVTIGTYTIPMGFFDVKKCSRQASTGIIKATCYNKLQSEYLDAKANDILLEGADVTETQGGYISVYTILNNVLQGYGIKELITKTVFSNLPVVPMASGTQSPDGGISLSDTPFGERDHALFYYNTNIVFPQVNRAEYYTVTSYGKYAAQSLADYLITWWPEAAQYKDKYIVGTDKTLYQWLAEGNVGSIRALPYVSPSVSTFHPRVLSDLSDDYISKAYTELYSFDFLVIGGVSIRGNDIDIMTIHRRLSGWLQDLTEPFGVVGLVTNITDIEKYRFNINDLSSLPDVTLRELQAAVYETSCQFGQLSRTTDLFSGVELNHSRLYPADSLYPATDLYPSGAVASGFRSMYSKLWADEGNVHKWRYLIITYKGLDGEGNEQDYTLQRTVNNDGTDNYNCSDNWLFRNLVWTAEQIGEYADAMVAKMQDVTWFPFEMWCAGLPYIETGDEIEIPLNGESYTSYVLQRQLKGIQNLQDTYINGTLDIF